MMMPLDECFVADNFGDTRLSEVQPASGEGEPGKGRSSHESSLYAGYGAWKEINLPQLQRDLGKQGLEIVANQKDSLQARKKLAEQTRDFKKLSEEERSKELKPLLKAYQSEIDVLTKKAKMAEGAFLNVYKVLAEAPDPAPLFQEVMNHHVQMSEIGSLQVNNARLNEEVETWATEVALLRGRDAEAKRLKQRLDEVESMMENVVKERVGEIEGQLRSELGEKLQHSIDMAQDLQRQLTIKQEEIARLQAVNNNTQAKLIQCSQLHEEEVTAKVGELEIVNFELQRTNRRIADLERRNGLLREEVDALQNNGSESMFAQLEEERKKNEAKLDRWILEADERTAEFQEKEAVLLSRLQELEQEILRKDDMISNANARLAEVADYDDIMKELHILKSVEFSISEVSGEETGQNGEAVSGETKNTLEHLLLAKNKKLQNEVTTLKTAHEELHRRILHLTTELSQRSATVEHYKALSTRLEEDLLRINPGGAEPSRSLALDHAGIQEIGGRPLSPAVAPVSSLAQMQSPGGETADFPRSPTTAGDPDLLSIITAQRNRFRQRNTELEEELRKQVAALSDIQGRFSAVEQDNVKLYEKIKYMQSYGLNRSGASRVISMGHVSSSSSRQVNSPYQRFDDPVTKKYRDMYEERLDPFKAFHRKEETRRYNSLNPADKATLSITRLLVGNRHFRLFLVVYSFMLHLLVLINTYQLVMTEECKHDHNEQICRQFATEFAAAGASVVGDPALAA